MVVAADRVSVVRRREAAASPAEGRYQQMEISTGPSSAGSRSTSRSTPTRATARYEHGLLTVELPIATKAPPVGAS